MFNSIPRKPYDVSFAIIAFGIGGGAQATLSRQNIEVGLALYVLAAILFAWAVGQTETGSDLFSRYRFFNATLGLTTGLRLQFGLLLISARSIASLISRGLFSVDGTPKHARWLIVENM